MLPPSLTSVVGLLAFVTASPANAFDLACQSLEEVYLPSVRIDAAITVDKQAERPAHCLVTGTILPAISFEVRLPAGDTWNGKSYQVGCGGFCGSISNNPGRFINEWWPGLERGYAVAANDGGHWGTNVLDARWAQDNRVAEHDWGYRAIGETARVTDALIQAYYNRPADRDYYQGCSTGGRQAVMAALKYPEAFDGIIAGAPALDYPGLVGTAFAHFVQANTADGQPILRPEMNAVIHQAVLEQCDGLDGVEDGLLADPRACPFDPSSLQCQGEDTSACLSAAEVDVVAAWYAGPRNSAGEQLYPGGQPVGSEVFWWLWLTTNGQGAGGLVPVFNRNFLAHMAFRDDPGEGFTPLDFDFDQHPADLAFMGAIYNADDPDLSDFQQAGGKMILYHGWADAIVTPFKTVEYVEQVQATLGDSASDTARLFMIPGMDHCGLLGSGVGITQWGFDPLTALETWVEEGAAPEQLLMTRRDGADDRSGEVIWQRPACPWPQEARFRGEGAWQTADNWACVTPR